MTVRQALGTFVLAGMTLLVPLTTAPACSIFESCEYGEPDHCDGNTIRSCQQSCPQGEGCDGEHRWSTSYCGDEAVCSSDYNRVACVPVGTQSCQVRPLTTANSTVGSGDADGDGHVDLILVSTAEIRVDLGGGRVVTTPLPPRTDSAPLYQFGTGDFDGDGHLDLYWDSSLRAYGDGKGAFEVQVTPVTPNHFVPMAIADVDGDGKSDILTNERDLLTVYFGTTDRHMRKGPDTPDGAQWALVAIGDFDGDGTPDVLNDQGLLRFGNRDGSFREGTERVPSLLKGSTGLDSMVVGDFDRDGHLDLIGSMKVAGNTVPVLRFGDGTGKFQPRAECATNVLAPGCVLTVAWDYVSLGWVADVDGNGSPDVIGQYRQSGTSLTFYLADGGHYRTKSISFPAAAQSAVMYEGELVVGTFSGAYVVPASCVR